MTSMIISSRELVNSVILLGYILSFSVKHVVGSSNLSMRPLVAPTTYVFMEK